MEPADVGTRIRVVSNKYRHPYTVGQVYTVKVVDNDGTFRAADDHGNIGGWIRWSECMPASHSTWEMLAAELPEPLLRFLSSFEGIRQISLKEKVIDAVLAKVPDMHERIVAASRTPIGEAVIAANMPKRTKEATAEASQQG